MLCPPAHAIEIARLTKSCPLMSSRDTSNSTSSGRKSLGSISGSFPSPERKFTTSLRCSAWYPSTLIMPTSPALPEGMTTLIPSPFAKAHMGKAPLISFNLPSSESSPTKIFFSTLTLPPFPEICPDAASIPMAIGRSYSAPSFFTSAGARFTVILIIGNSNPEFFMALLTLSLDSFTAESGRPTMLKDGIPGDISTSTSTRYPSIPKSPAERTFETLFPSSIQKV